MPPLQNAHPNGTQSNPLDPSYSDTFSQGHTDLERAPSQCSPSGHAFLNSTPIPCVLPKFTLIGNWKMYGGTTQVKAFFNACLPPPPGVQAVICPPFVYLPLALACLAEKNLASRSTYADAVGQPHTQHASLAYALGGQTCSPHSQEGAFTGQVQAAMLWDVGCRFVILGHPERRSWETSRILACQIQAALGAGLQPVVCLTNLEDLNTLQERLQGETTAAQGDLFSRCWLAFEPAVGAPCPPPQALTDLQTLRDTCPHHTLLYGGGISPDTLPLVQGLVDGVLVGRASLHADSWNALLAASALTVG